MKCTVSVARRGKFILFGIFALGQPARADLSGLFVGGSFGRDRINYDASRFETQLVGEASKTGALAFTNSAPQKRSNAWWADAGYMVWPNVGIDAAFLHLGDLIARSSGNYTPTGLSAKEVVATQSLHSSGPALSLLFRAPLIESLDVDLRIGDYLGRTRQANGVQINAYSVTTQSVRASSLLVGVGAAYNFGGNWSARLDYIRVNQAGTKSVGTYSVDLASLGVRYTF